jgi:hypothetical protein
MNDLHIAQTSVDARTATEASPVSRFLRLRDVLARAALGRMNLARPCIPYGMTERSSASRSQPMLAAECLAERVELRSAPADSRRDSALTLSACSSTSDPCRIQVGHRSRR